jgi:dihydrofolate reductase/thymidylate synthase
MVARNLTNGIGYNKSIPWPHDSDHIKLFTTQTNNQVIIMGRNTWQSLVTRPFKNRINIILTNDPKQLAPLPPNCFAFKSIKECDQFLNENHSGLVRWVVGGFAVYDAFMKLNLVSEVLISQYNTLECCDKSFNWFTNGQLHGFTLESSESRSRFVLLRYKKDNTEELTLLSAMRDIITNGVKRPNRTGIDTRSVFGRMFEYHMEEQINPQTGQSMYRLPLLTTKKMFTRGVFAELKWFLNGRVDSKELETKGINIWKGNTTRTYLDGNNLSEYNEGETGPIYGFQWRHWGANYAPNKKEYSMEGIDQVSKVIHTLKTDPFSRRHIISGWNVADLDKMCLPPCFVANTMVLTKHGYTEIQYLLDNDLVFTHLGNWKPIINRQERTYAGSLYTINHVGNSESIYATEEHPFLVKLIQMVSFEPAKYKLSAETQWIPAKELNPEKHVLCLPIVQEQQPVSITIAINGELAMSQPIDYFMVGIYVGKQGNILDLQFIPPGWSILRQFSKYPMNSCCDIIPEWVQCLPQTDLADLIKGFEFASVKHPFIYFSIINKQVALSLQRIYAKLGIPVRVVSKEMNYTIIKITSDLQGRCYADDQYMYLPIVSSMATQTNQIVYNLEVADDNSYVVENIATHNCHMLYQFMVHETDNQKYLSLMMTQRSCDTFLGLPFNVCSLGMFLFLMAETVGMKPHKIIHSIADMHIYETHIQAAEQQISRTPYAFPYIQMRINTHSKPIETYEYSDIQIINYYSHKSIGGAMVA